jgi:hypothetical protein
MSGYYPNAVPRLANPASASCEPWLLCPSACPSLPRTIGMLICGRISCAGRRASAAARSAFNTATHPALSPMNVKKSSTLTRPFSNGRSPSSPLTSSAPSSIFA